jgi:hypothetical protein
MEVIEFIFSNFWTWLGSMLLIGVLLSNTLKLIKYLLSLLIISFRGYPPEHCDAVGENNVNKTLNETIEKLKEKLKAEK